MIFSILSKAFSEMGLSMPSSWMAAIVLPWVDGTMHVTPGEDKDEANILGRTTNHPAIKRTTVGGNFTVGAFRSPRRET